MNVKIIYPSLNAIFAENAMEQQNPLPIWILKIEDAAGTFPKYNLVDIKNIINLGQKSFIINLSKMSSTNVSQYFIEAKGLFKQEEYEIFMADKEDTDFEIDPKLFFRICPFCGFKGCTLDFSLRPHPCNLYLCRSIIDICGEPYKAYSNERKDYFSYCNFYNEYIKEELMENNVDFIKDIDRSLNIIENLNIPTFEPRKLEPIIFFSEGNYIPA